MFKNTIRGIFNSKWTMLCALFLFVTIAFIALRASVGFGPILAAGLISYFTAWLAIRELRQAGNRSLIASMAYHLMIAAFILWLITFALVEFYVVTEGNAEIAAKGEYLVVLGAGLKGEVPSISLSGRLQTALEYLKQNKDVKAIVSGGRGQGENISEAEAMRRYLVGKGIGEERIIKEEQSTSTRENLMFSKAILEAQKAAQEKRLIIVTSDYHAFRTRIIARGLGLEVSILPSKTPMSVYLSGCVREYFAVMDTLILGALK